MEIKRFVKRDTDYARRKLVDREHIVQFAVSIDEEFIANRAIEKAAGAIMETVREDLCSYTRKYYGESELDKIFREEVKALVNEHKDEILDEAIKKVASNIIKTKAYKEKFKNEFENVEVEND